jgi:hypothetical protein
VPADAILDANVRAAILGEKVVKHVFAIWCIAGTQFYLPDFFIADTTLPMHRNRGHFQIDVPGVAALRSKRTGDSDYSPAHLRFTGLRIPDIGHLRFSHKRPYEEKIKGPLCLCRVTRGPLRNAAAPSHPT